MNPIQPNPQPFPQVQSLITIHHSQFCQVKANHSSLQQPVILRRQGLLQQVAALVYDAKDDVQYKVVCSHLAVFKNAVLLSQSIHRLETLGEGVVDRAKKDKKKVMISQVLAAGMSYSKAVGDLDQLKADNMPDDQDLLLVAAECCCF